MTAEQLWNVVQLLLLGAGIYLLYRVALWAYWRWIGRTDWAEEDDDDRIG